MPDAPIHPAALPLDDLLADCEVTRTRRSGPGGQHRNKRDTAVVISHQPSGCSGEAGERRSQPQNHAIAAMRLRVALAKNVRIDEAYEPTELWRRRCKNGRIVVSESHDDFPAVLAEALDAITRLDYDFTEAGEHLGCSTAQLVKLLRRVPEVLQHVNRIRQDAGQPKLR